MQLIQISPSYKPAYQYGGPTISVSMLCEQLQTSNLKLLVFTTTANGDKELEVPLKSISIIEGVPVQYFKRISKDHSHFSPALCLHLYLFIRRKLKNKEQVILHIHSWWNLVSIISCLIGRLYKIPIILSPRGMLTDYTFRHRKGFMKRCIHLLAGKWMLDGCHLHATSQKERHDILSFLNPKSLVVIPNLIQHPSVGVGMPTADTTQPFKLLYFSRVDKKKGIELLLHAAALLTLDYKLTIAGTGSEAYIEDLKAMARSLGISKNINWLGHVTPENKYTVMCAYDLMVLPSYNENYANVVIECLSVGTAVLISDQVGLADYVQASGLGWVSKLNSTELSINIMRITKAKETLRNIRVNAPKKISRDFNTSVILQRYLDYYNHLSTLSN
jgi:glycosyltransferase involved in cell wall biosynthesis